MAGLINAARGFGNAVVGALDRMRGTPRAPNDNDLAEPLLPRDDGDLEAQMGPGIQLVDPRARVEDAARRRFDNEDELKGGPRVRLAADPLPRPAPLAPLASDFSSLLTQVSQLLAAIRTLKEGDESAAAQLNERLRRDLLHGLASLMSDKELPFREPDLVREMLSTFNRALWQDIPIRQQIENLERLESFLHVLTHPSTYTYPDSLDRIAIPDDSLPTSIATRAGAYVVEGVKRGVINERDELTVHTRMLLEGILTTAADENLIAARRALYALQHGDSSPQVIEAAKTAICGLLVNGFLEKKIIRGLLAAPENANLIENLRGFAYSRNPSPAKVQRALQSVQLIYDKTVSFLPKLTDALHLASEDAARRLKTFVNEGLFQQADYQLRKLHGLLQKAHEIAQAYNQLGEGDAAERGKLTAQLCAIAQELRVLGLHREARQANRELLTPFFPHLQKEPGKLAQYKETLVNALRCFETEQLTPSTSERLLGAAVEVLRESIEAQSGPITKLHPLLGQVENISGNLATAAENMRVIAAPPGAPPPPAGTPTALERITGEPMAKLATNFREGTSNLATVLGHARVMTENQRQAAEEDRRRLDAKGIDADAQTPALDNLVTISGNLATATGNICNILGRVMPHLEPLLPPVDPEGAATPPASLAGRVAARRAGAPGGGPDDGDDDPEKKPVGGGLPPAGPGWRPQRTPRPPSGPAGGLPPAGPRDLAEDPATYQRYRNLGYAKRRLENLAAHLEKLRDPSLRERHDDAITFKTTDQVIVRGTRKALKQLGGSERFPLLCPALKGLDSFTPGVNNRVDIQTTDLTLKQAVQLIRAAATEIDQELKALSGEEAPGFIAKLLEEFKDKFAGAIHGGTQALSQATYGGLADLFLQFTSHLVKEARLTPNSPAAQQLEELLQTVEGARNASDRRHLFGAFQRAIDTFRNINLHIHGFNPFAAPTLGDSSAQFETEQTIAGRIQAMQAYLNPQQPASPARAHMNKEEFEGALEKQKQQAVQNFSLLTTISIVARIWKIKEPSTGYFMKMVRDHHDNPNRLENRFEKMLDEKLKDSWLQRNIAKVAYSILSSVLTRTISNYLNSVLKKGKIFIAEQGEKNYVDIKNTILSRLQQYFASLNSIHKNYGTKELNGLDKDGHVKESFQLEEFSDHFPTPNAFNQAFQEGIVNTFYTTGGWLQAATDRLSAVTSNSLAAKAGAFLLSPLIIPGYLLLLLFEGAFDYLMARPLQKLLLKQGDAANKLIDIASANFQDEQGYSHALTSFFCKRLFAVWEELKRGSDVDENGQPVSTLSAAHEQKLISLFDNFFAALSRDGLNTSDQLYNMVHNPSYATQLQQALHDAMARGAIKALVTQLATAIERTQTKETFEDGLYNLFTAMNTPFEVAPEVSTADKKKQEELLKQLLQDIVTRLTRKEVDRRFRTGVSNQQKALNQCVNQVDLTARDFHTKMSAQLRRIDQTFNQQGWIYPQDLYALNQLHRDTLNQLQEAQSNIQAHAFLDSTSRAKTLEIYAQLIRELNEMTRASEALLCSLSEHPQAYMLSTRRQQAIAQLYQHMNNLLLTADGYNSYRIPNVDIPFITSAIDAAEKQVINIAVDKFKGGLRLFQNEANARGFMKKYMGAAIEHLNPDAHRKAQDAFFKNRKRA